MKLTTHMGLYSSAQPFVLKWVFFATSSEKSTGVTALSELGLWFLVFQHSVGNHSTLKLSCRCLGQKIGQEDLQTVRIQKSCGRGIRGISHTCLGTLSLASLAAIHLRSSSEVVFSPSFSTTARPISWPYVLSAMAKQTASTTDGCWDTTFSSSTGLIFSPPLFMSSLILPVMMT